MDLAARVREVRAELGQRHRLNRSPSAWSKSPKTVGGDASRRACGA
jgi:hypothetical protein